VLITPWNDPLLTPARKLAPALFVGTRVKAVAVKST
jgi:alpha-ketoglutaric semialdehyde dehydrogenase